MSSSELSSCQDAQCSGCRFPPAALCDELCCTKDVVALVGMLPKCSMLRLQLFVMGCGIKMMLWHLFVHGSLHLAPFDGSLINSCWSFSINTDHSR
jgi:hypothetical protein